MIYKADLHTHSTASDGQYTPEELAVLVKKRGAEAWALTDHDNVGGVEKAKAAGEALGLRVIQGVELSADDYLNLHILGYGFAVSAIQSGRGYCGTNTDRSAFRSIGMCPVYKQKKISKGVRKREFS